MKCRMMAFHQFTSVKNMHQKIYFTIEMQPNIFFKVILMPNENATPRKMTISF